MNINRLLEIFVRRCSTIKGFIQTKKGRNLFLIAVLIFVLLFFAPLFQGAVGTALVACVGAEFLVLSWRRFDKRHAVVPAVFFCVPMILDMFIYHTLSIAVCLLVAMVCVLATSIHPVFDNMEKVSDDMYAYLIMGAICVADVILASFFILLVSIAWWIFCLLAFLAVIAIFFTVVLSTAAYTATDAKRQARKKNIVQDEEDDDSYYSFDSFEIKEKKHEPIHQKPQRERTVHIRERKDDTKLYYDVD